MAHPWTKKLHLTKPPCTAEMYLSHRVLGGRLVSSLTQHHLPNAQNGSTLPSPRHFLSSIQMTYFNNNDDDVNPYFTSFAYQELDPYQFLSQTSTGEWANDQTNDTFAHGWGMVDQSGPMVDSPIGSRAVASYGEYHCSLFVVR